MLGKIISTVFVRGYAAVANLAVVVLSAKYLGAEARGTIALVILGVTIVGMVQSVVGGPSLTYFAPKRSVKSLIKQAVIWSVISGITIGAFISFLNLSPWEYVAELITISVFQGIITAQHSLLVGKEKVYSYGWLDAIRTTVLWSYITVRFFVFDSVNIDEIFFAYILANALTVGFGFVVLRNEHLKNNSLETASFREMIRYGSEIQLNNLSQLFNYRFVYFVIERLKGMEALGVFSVAVSIAESVWIICKSIATIQLSRLVNIPELNDQKKLTNKLAFTSVVVTTIATLILWTIPSTLFTYVFGSEFSSVPDLIRSFTPAIILLSAYTIHNHFFIARDQNWINIRASLLGNMLFLVVTYFAILHFDLTGAALSYGVAFLGMAIYLEFAFLRAKEKHE
ncbi:MAG: hypothetical protein EP333_04635 [Bacteroidetes bacterium]|nr:MAG: hypothetical protein EP333_04635 [Bacteroidota bacterium]